MEGIFNRKWIWIKQAHDSNTVFQQREVKSDIVSKETVYSNLAH